MSRKRLVTLITAAGAVALVGSLHVALGPINTLVVVAVATVLLAHYLVRDLARHALIRGRP